MDKGLGEIVEPEGVQAVGFGNKRLDFEREERIMNLSLNIYREARRTWLFLLKTYHVAISSSITVCI